MSGNDGTDNSAPETIMQLQNSPSENSVTTVQPQLIVQSQIDSFGEAFYDLDERGLGEDIPLTHYNIWQTSTELPKEVVAAMAASAIGGTTILIVLVLVAVALGLAIGLGVGAGVGVGVGLGLQTCPRPSISSTNPGKFPLCFPTGSDQFNMTVYGSNFYQEFARDGKLIGNPTLSLTGTNVAPINITELSQVDCSVTGTTGSGCGIIKTTPVKKSYFNLGSGSDSLNFEVRNGQCLVPGATSIGIWAVEPAITGVVGNTFCISDISSDPNYAASIKLSGQGFTMSSDATIGTTKTKVQVTGLGTLPVVTMGSCTDPANTNFRICKELTVQVTGADFFPFTPYPASITYASDLGTCQTSQITLQALAASTASSISPNSFVCRQVSSATITGTNFLKTLGSTTYSPTFYLQDASNPNGPHIAASSSTIQSDTSALVSFNGLSHAITYVVVTEMSTCGKKVASGVTVTFDSVTTVTSPSYTLNTMSPDCRVLTTCSGNGKFTVTITTSGSFSNPTRITLTDGSNVKTQVLTPVDSNTGTFYYNGGNAFKGTWTMRVFNADGCIASNPVTVKWN